MQPQLIFKTLFIKFVLLALCCYGVHVNIPRIQISKCKNETKISIAFLLKNVTVIRVGKIAVVPLFSTIANSDSGSGYRFSEK